MSELAYRDLEAAAEAGALDQGTGAFPAAILQRVTTAELVELAKTKRALDPAVFDEFPPYGWGAQISSNRLDAYSTRMAASSLNNYADDAEAGVSFQDSHKTDGLARTFGQSLTGKYTGPGGDGIAHVEADFYTLVGIDPGIDTFVRKARAGIVRDVSIGFYGGRFMCSICGKDMLRDWDCWHYPGVEYDLRDEEGRKTGEKAVAVADIEDAHLAEVSAVYDGATPGAALLKLYREIEAGRAKPELIRAMEQRYRIKLPTPARTVAPPTPRDQEVRVPKNTGAAQNDLRGVVHLDGSRLTDAQRTALLEATEGVELVVADVVPLGTLREVLTAAGVELKATDEAAVLAAFRETVAENARLRPLADEGRAYRAAILEEALTEGVRAQGDAFKREQWESWLKAMPLEAVREHRDTWKQQGDAKLPGGRATREDADPKADTAVKTERTATPAAAHRV